ncbi:uncharacterized protein LOC142326690 isoform X2 [Lycorma delicatula]|uniref:uncharacterized protein LOC142326690 isoform X2 n=1 Tax=Lycorma delicatula TaxID=130591 RepID=UPI003F517AF2
MLVKLKNDAIQSDTSTDDGTSNFNVPLPPELNNFHISNPHLLKIYENFRKNLNGAHEKLNVDTLAALYCNMIEIIVTHLNDNDHKMPDSTMLNENA